MAKQNGSSAGAWAAFLGGAALGLGAAYLAAPKAGDEARKNLAKLADEAREKSLDAVERGKGYLERKRTQMGSAMQAARAVLDAVRK